MKIKLMLLAVTLVSFSGGAAAFDLGKFLEDRVKQELNKDKPTQPEPSQTTKQAPAASQSAAASPPPAGQKVDAAQLGFALFGEYSLEEENRIGSQISGNLLGAVQLVRDDKLQNYVNLVGHWVALQSGRQDVTWRFGVLDTEDINAFAAPGGYIFVTKGLYRLLDNEADLAGVLGHEIAHVTQKHHLKVLKQSSLIGALGQAASRKVQGSDPVVQNLIGNGAEIMARGTRQECRIRGRSRRHGVRGARWLHSLGAAGRIAGHGRLARQGQPYRPALQDPPASGRSPRSAG